MRYKKYDRDDAHAYTFGVFSTIELLTHQPSRVREVLFHSSGERNEGVNKIRALCAAAHISINVEDKLIERLSPKENHFAVGVFEKYQPQLNPIANHIVLVNPSDMGNAGTIMRTMLGFGFRDLALIRPAVDIYDPRALRASMGGLFQLNFAYYATFEAYQSVFRHKIYPFMTHGEISLPAAHFDSPYALIFGNESSGLPESYRSVGTSITIPQTDAIDSLNLAIAVGIALYQAATPAPVPP